MQNNQLKRPYLPPEMTSVEFRVEVGTQPSGGISDSGLNGLQVSDPNNQTLGQSITSKFLTPEDYRYSQNGMLNGNSGYFSYSGNASDGGGYFGSSF